MAQCYQCGSSVDTTDRFCMECGTEYPARTPPAPEAAPPAAPAAAPNQPSPAQPMPSARSSAELDEAPTVLDSTGGVQAAASAAKADTAGAAQADNTVACPNCAARLPRGARFCGDCGTRLPDASAADPAPARPLRAPVALPDPIPPLSASAGAKPASGPAQPVLPPFRASNQAEQPIPDEERLDQTQPPTHQQAAPPGGQAAPGWVNPPAPVPQGAAQPAPWQPGQPPAPPSWQPGQPAGNSNASSFQPPGAFPQMPANAAPFQGPFPPQPAAGSVGPPQAPFLQAMAALPPVSAAPTKRGAPRKGHYPRGQVITMLIVALVTVMAALGGLIVLLAQK